MAQAQSFIVSGALDTFEREIDLADPNAEEKIAKLAKKFRTLFDEMRERANELKAQGTETR